MLHTYTRHAAGCGHANDTQWRRCRCPKWLRGVLPNGEPIRESAGTRSWEQAERNARKKEAEADPTRVDQAQPRRATVKDAIRMFLEDEEARGLEHSSRKKSRTLFERQFLPFCEGRKFVHIDQIVPVDLTEFRSTWNNGEVTTHRKHERMHSFFAFCVANDLRRKNPMDALKKPKTPDVVPTDYFLPQEFEQIVAATRKYEYGGGNDNEHRGQRLRALTLLMRWSGLAILDATSLERERLSTNENGDDQIFLYRAKTGVANAKVQVSEGRLALDDTSVMAPFSGVIVTRRIELGDLVSNTTPAFTVADISVVKADFAVPESMLFAVRRGETLTFSLSNGAREFPATVTAISPSADSQSRVFTIELTLRNPRQQLKPGMVGSIELHAQSQQRSCILLPIAALVSSKNSGGFAVFVLHKTETHAQVHQQPVTVGESVGSNICADAGVAAGEQIVTAGAQTLRDGDAVRVLE